MHHLIEPTVRRQRHPLRRRTALTATTLMATVLLAAGCGLDDNGRTWAEGATEPGVEERAEEAVPVEVTTLERGPIEAMLRFSSTLEAERDVQVFAEAPRRVVELRVEEGDVVDVGEVLLRLQDDEQRSAVAKAEIRLAQAEREWQRQQNLYDQDLTSEQVFADSRSEYDQARLALDDARRQLGYTMVRAPVDGTVTERMVNLGDHVTVNQPLFRIVDFDSIVARIYVPEKELPRLRPGLEARLSSEALAGDAFRGTIERIAPAVDPSTGTVKVTVATPPQPALRPGMYVEVELVTATHPDAVLLPKKAVVYDNEQTFAFRLGEERRVARVEVEATLENAELIEPAGGFEAGDRVVVAGQSGLKDGALVRLPEDPEPTPTPATDDAR